MPLVISRADAFLARRPELESLRDDLIAAANLALVEAIYSLRRPHDAIAEITAYFLKIISRSFCQTADSDACFGPCPRVKRAKEGCSAPGREPIDLTQLADDCHLDRLEQREELDACCQTRLEERYVTLQRECCPDFLSDEAAGELLGVSRMTASRARHALAKRYEDREFGMGA